MPKDGASPLPAPFPGFDAPTSNYFRLPLAWTDITAGINNIAELKVVEYILRHTWGYQEYGIKKHITIDEFMRGRRRQNGSRMDRGTGLSERAVRYGLDHALEHGLIEEAVDDSDRGRIKKYYSLKMRPDTADPGPAEGERQDLQPGVQTLHLGVQPLPGRGARVAPRSEKDTSDQNLKTQQHPLTPIDPPPETANRPGAVVVLDRSRGERISIPGEGRTVSSSGSPSPGPAHADPQDARADVLGQAALTNDLISRGVSAKAAQKWMRERTHEYIQELIEYHDWCQEHRKGFIHDSGAWLSRALAEAITFPDFYRRGREREELKKRQAESQAEEDRMALLDEARRRASPVEERVRKALAGWVSAYELAHHGRPPTQAAQDAWYERRLAITREQDAAFFAEHPALRGMVAPDGETLVQANGHISSSVAPRAGPS